MASTSSWTQDEYKKRTGKVEKSHFSFNPANAVDHSDSSHWSLEQFLMAKSDGEIVKRMRLRDCPALLGQYFGPLTGLTFKKTRSATYLAIAKAGMREIEQLQSLDRYETVKTEALDNMNPLSRPALYKPVLAELRFPELFNQTQSFDFSLEQWMAERLEEWADTLSLTQTVLLRTAVVGAFSRAEPGIFIPKSVVEICKFEIERFDRVLADDLDERLQVIDLINEFQAGNAA